MRIAYWVSSRLRRAASLAMALVLLAAGTAHAFTKPVLFDNTTTPTNTLVSYYNAINRDEEARAYSYILPQSRLTFRQFEDRWNDTTYVRIDSMRIVGYYSASSVQAAMCVSVRLDIFHSTPKPQHYRGWYVLQSTTGEEPNFGGWRIDLPSSHLDLVHRGEVTQDSCHVLA